MCTVSWCRDGRGYHVFFNRDERKSRGRAKSIATDRRNGTSYIAPTDTDAGGTWLAANAHGVTLAVLNRYGDAVATTGPPVSRGRLVRDLADVPGMASLATRLGGTSLRQYPPMSLVGFEPGSPATVFVWNGDTLALHRHEEEGMVLTSSALDQEEIVDVRMRTFDGLRDGAVTPSLLHAFHRSHLPVRGPASVCMHRNEAETQAFSHVYVSRDEVRVEHVAGAPCGAGEPDRIAIGRAALIATP